MSSFDSETDASEDFEDKSLSILLKLGTLVMPEKQILYI
jgi:hypothetical protein